MFDTHTRKGFRYLHFSCFARNERWGTCVDCPRDITGMIYPEFCENTKRYDHQLELFELIEALPRYKD